MLSGDASTSPWNRTSPSRPAAATATALRSFATSIPTKASLVSAMVRPPLVRRGSYHPAGGRSVASLVCAGPHWGGHTVLRSAWPRCRPARGRTDGRRAHGSDRARERSRGPDFPVPSRLERAQRDRPRDQPGGLVGLERGLGPLGE